MNPDNFKPTVTAIGLHGIPPFRPRSILRRLVAVWAIAVISALVGLLIVAEATMGLLEAVAGTSDWDASVFYLAEARADLTDWLKDRFLS